MGRVKGLTPEETRRRVIDGAAEAFAELGFEGARVSDIARAAGLSSGAMYNHFESKSDLLGAVIECHAGNELMKLVESGTTSGLLDVVLARAKELGRPGTMPAPLLLEAINSARRDPDVLRILSEQVTGREDLFTTLIASAQSEGQVTDEVDPRATARFMLSVLIGSLIVQAMELPPLEAPAWESFMTRLIETFRPQENP
jgi:AcrR family transcriptional regulator